MADSLRLAEALTDNIDRVLAGYLNVLTKPERIRAVLLSVFSEMELRDIHEALRDSFANENLYETFRLICGDMT